MLVHHPSYSKTSRVGNSLAKIIGDNSWPSPAFTFHHMPFLTLSLVHRKYMGSCWNLSQLLLTVCHLIQSRIQSLCRGLEDFISCNFSLVLISHYRKSLFAHPQPHQVPSCPGPVNSALFARNHHPPIPTYLCIFFHCFIILYYWSPLGTLSTYLFIGCLSSQENISLRAGTFCFVYFCVSSAWFILGTCA
jgi:hypothetical protein